MRTTLDEVPERIASLMEGAAKKLEREFRRAQEARDGRRRGGERVGVRPA